MNIFPLAIGIGFILLAGGMLRLFWYIPKNTPPAAAERFRCWRTDIGLGAMVATIVAPFSVMGVSLVLAAFESTAPLVYIFKQIGLLLCAAATTYFYFSKRRSLADPSPMAINIFSDMRWSAVFFGVFAVTDNTWIAIGVSALTQLGYRAFTQRKK
jgi:hypothetical protein